MTPQKPEDAPISGQNIVIAPELRRLGVPLVLGVLLATVQVDENDVATWQLLQSTGETAARGLTAETLKQQDEIAAFRQLYHAIGKDPSRYRPSSEALIRRVIREKGLYHVNNVVDAGNVLSIETRMPYGIYDADAIHGDVNFRIGQPSEAFKGIRKDMINVESLPVFVDQIGPFGNPTSDSERTMIRPETENILMIMISCSGNQTRMIGVLKRAEELLAEYTHGQGFQTKIVT